MSEAQMTLQSILPPNRTELEAALEAVTSRAFEVPMPNRDIWNPETCPANLLGWLAWALSADDWDSGWSETTKRATLREVVAVHRAKGTVASVTRALKSAGYGDASITERFGWEFYDGAARHDGSITYSEPDHWAEYRVYLTRPISIAQGEQVRAILSNVAPARAHLKGLFFTEALNLYDNSIVHDGAFTHGVA